MLSTNPPYPSQLIMTLNGYIFNKVGPRISPTRLGARATPLYGATTGRNKKKKKKVYRRKKNKNKTSFKGTNLPVKHVEEKVEDLRSS